ncbi:Na/Pi symporter [Paenibacillus aurantius]|uniref:Na/Pi symporter n=1 Tax=Paenibacillus aurantius TaxID=2918900 RepID=A0AA96LGJ5_9BACL|nr:Na/Pi symporter [Paenibacillus aurantius]WNQ13446.1 Na/Pi symporter [Paenibacillus aurantius]
MLHAIVLPLAAGFAMFMLGMKGMEFALHRWAGSLLQTVLERFTQTPARGLLASTALTAVLQSSTAVTVLTIGLVNSGLLAFPQTLGIILGSNIGTCITTELLGLSLQQYGVPLLFAAAAVWASAGLVPARLDWAPHLRAGALAAAGFACLLLGMDVMQSIVPELKARGLLAWLVQRSQESRLWGIAAGAAVTALIHSSAATIAMAMSLAAAQAIPPELGIAIVIGANVGTCATAVIASIGGSRYGGYVAWSHVLLNLGGALLFYPLLPALTTATAWFSESPAAQIAHAQTVFNIVCSLAALPLCYLPVLKKIRPA